MAFVADIAIPSARQCFALLAPVLAFFVVRAVLRGIDVVIARLFPGMEWQRQLGWFNLRAERQATTALRWLGYLFCAALAVALYGIVWCAEGLRQLDQWTDPMVTGNLAVKIYVLAFCLAFWAFYLGAVLIPKLRRQFEEEELQRFRDEQAARELEHENDSRIQAKPQLWPKPASRSRQ